LRIGCALVVIAGLSLPVPPASGSAEVQWKAILLAGDSSAPVFDKEASRKDPASEPQAFIGEGMKDVPLPPGPMTGQRGPARPLP
jgi:hypothetical protein